MKPKEIDWSEIHQKAKSYEIPPVPIFTSRFINGEKDLMKIDGAAWPQLLTTSEIIHEAIWSLALLDINHINERKRSRRC